nr:DsbA family oxidoreductase [uncultured Sphingomonas sp.]
MPRQLTIDFVSDVVCPWCVIGLKGLEEALARASDAVTAEIRFHPFELNPAMAPEGENIVEHIGRKYGATPEQSAGTRAMIRERAAALDFTMAMVDDSRIYNTFDAHRLLHWAGLAGDQRALKMALFTAYFTDGENPGDGAVLLAAAEQAGLDAAEAARVLDEGRYAEKVRAGEALWQSRGIQSVPAIVIDQRYLISGGQPPEAFEQALRQIAAEPAGL